MTPDIALLRPHHPPHRHSHMCTTWQVLGLLETKLTLSVYVRETDVIECIWQGCRISTDPPNVWETSISSSFASSSFITPTPSTSSPPRFHSIRYFIRYNKHTLFPIYLFVRLDDERCPIQDHCSTTRGSCQTYTSLRTVLYLFLQYRCRPRTSTWNNPKKPLYLREKYRFFSHDRRDRLLFSWK
jgi:hypothetical protein